MPTLKKRQAILTGSRFGSGGNRSRSFFSIRRRVVTIVTRFTIVGCSRAQDVEAAFVNIIAVIHDAKSMDSVLGHSCGNSSQKQNHHWHEASRQY
jgi:hypothetical protein